MPIQRVQSFYQQRAKLYQRFFINFLQWEKVLETFFQADNFLRPNIKILDAGCGTGPVTKVLYRLARQQGLEDIGFYGFDLTPAMLALFQQWIEEDGAQGIQLRQANGLNLKEQLPSEWNNFDWIVSSTMLENISKELRRKALSNLKELLYPNGHILLFLTKRTWIARWTGTKWWGINLFDREELITDLRHAGYSDIQYHPLPKRWDSFMLAVEARLEPGARAYPAG